MTLVDLNRAGSALIEIVSGPDMRSPEQAGAYVRKLRDVLRHIGASDGNMDEGSMRCDVNVSVHRFGQPWGLRCEVKNLNSIKFVMNAISEWSFGAVNPRLHASMSLKVLSLPSPRNAPPANDS